MIITLKAIRKLTVYERRIEMTYPNRPRWIAILLSVVLIATAASVAQEAPAPLTLRECIIRAVRHNLDVAVQVYGSEMAGLAVAYRNDTTAVAADYERVGAFQAARELAEQKLAAEEAKLKVGLTQDFFILQYQRDLAGAWMGELRALIDRTLSISRLEKATGTGLDRRNIKITEATEIEL